MGSTTNHSLSASQLREYARNGIVYPIEVMPVSTAQNYRAGFEELEVELGGHTRYVAMTHLYFRWAFEVAVEPKILDAVELILGPDLLVQSTLILCKYPNDESFVTWHQDFNYASQDSSPTISAWLALSDSTRQSGCLRAIPGSQQAGVLPHADSVVENNMLTYSLEVDDSSAIDVELKAGEMSLHQAGIIHGSLPNKSGDKRIGFIIRFVTPQFARTENPVVRARGNGVCRHLDVWPAPGEDDIENSVMAWKKFARTRSLLK
jgi:non-heme Fe2+,alpha-ketoglutarate-dependent halogenase